MSSDSESGASFPKLSELIQRGEQAKAAFWKTVADDGRSHKAFSAGAGCGFLMVEADTGFTFAWLALTTTDDPDKAQRNTANAKKAYDTILRFRARVQLNPQETAALGAKLARLRTMLLKLGEAV